MGQKPKVGELLLAAGVIDEYQLRSALGEQRRWGSRVGMTLVKMGFLEEADLVRVLASQLGLPVAHLEGKRILSEVLDLVPVSIAEKQMVLPLFVKHEGGVNTLYLGMEDPTDLEAVDDVSFRTGMQVKPVLVGPSELSEGIDRFYRHRDEAGDDVLSDSTLPSDASGSRSSPATPADSTTSTADPGETRPELPDLDLEIGGVGISLAEDPAAQLEASFRGEVPATAAPARSAAPGPSGGGGGRSGLVVQAVTQLLIEKGILGREELVARVRRLEGGEGDEIP